MNYQYKLYNRLKYIYLSRTYISQEEYYFIKIISDDDINMFFKIKKNKINNFICTLGNLVLYQKIKKEKKSSSKLLSILKDKNRNYLWSDLLGLSIMTKINDPKFLGLSLISCFNKKQALLYSIRTGIKNYENKVIIKNPKYINYILFKIKKNIKFDV